MHFFIPLQLPNFPDKLEPPLDSVVVLGVAFSFLFFPTPCAIFVQPFCFIQSISRAANPDTLEIDKVPKFAAYALRRITRKSGIVMGHYCGIDAMERPHTLVHTSVSGPRNACRIVPCSAVRFTMRFVSIVSSSVVLKLPLLIMYFLFN